MTDYELVVKACNGNVDDANDHLRKGVWVFSDFIENFTKYMSEWECSIDEIEEYIKMIKYGYMPEGWVTVEDDEGKIVYIQYCL